ncbi:unnamed protein product [Sphagnum tenellum]
MASTFVSLCQPALDVSSIKECTCSRSLQNFNNKCTSKLMQVPPHIDHKPNYNKKNKDKQKMKKHRQSPSPGEASGSKPKKRKHRGHSPE